MSQHLSSSSVCGVFRARRMSRFAAGVIFAGVVAGLGLCRTSSADPLPGEVLKFYQAPLNNFGPIYPPGATPTSLDIPASPKFTGHDELSTATYQPASGGYAGTMMADDFGDNFTTPIVHVMFWGSYLAGTQPQAPGAGVQKFQITFYTDNPAVAGSTSASSPLVPYSTQTVSFATALAPKSGTFTEKPVPGTSGPPGNLESGLYQYNAELAVPAAEPVATNPTGGQPIPGPVGTVDWISIVALVGGPNSTTPNIQWGWHDRDYGIFDPLAIGPNLTGPGENNLNPGLVNPPQQPVWHFQDDAVSNNTYQLNANGIPIVSGPYIPQTYIPGIDLPSSSPAYSKDLAFALYTTVPEPASLGVVVLAGLVTLRRRYRPVG
jgi:hypothetical protein